MSVIKIDEKIVNKNGEVIIQTKEINYLNNYTMMYTEDTAELFIKIDKANLNLALYLINNYGDKGEVILSGHTFTQFKEYLKQNDVEPYHIGTIRRCVQELHKVEFIIRLARSHYAINPKYFFKGNPKDREQRIKDLFSYAEKYKQT